LARSGRSAAAGPAADQVTRAVNGRDRRRTAPARCLCYAAFSELMASPHEVDTRASCREKIGAGAPLGYAAGLDDLIREFAAAETAPLRSAYSRLFEVGDGGAPAPVREDLMTGQKAGIREEIVRFYDFFGYALGERFAWAPDHLSVELEFVHFLCFREAQEGEDVLSCQLAQADFSARHLCNWVPMLRERVASLAPGTLYCRVVSALQAFVQADLSWQQGTIVGTPPPSGS